MSEGTLEQVDGRPALEAMEQSGEVLRFEPPYALKWEWGGERFSFRLEPDGDGILLTFVHVFGDLERGADFASGWHHHLGRLQAHLDGEPVPEAEPAELGRPQRPLLGAVRPRPRGGPAGDRRVLRRPRVTLTGSGT